ncbi:MAG: hypothetical protein QOJ21_1572 [Solirubrobacteraceae bacterium]|jgi:hypothetical protein|nr:hypothetical protein [Solirubrobacteraceae bacterium]
MSTVRRASPRNCSWEGSPISPRRVLLLAVLLVLAAPATAPAALRIGIAENTPNLFSDPLFQALGARYARVVVSYDAMTSGDDELQRVTDYLNGAAAAGVEPLVTFEHARGAAEICNKRSNRRKRQCRLPTPKAYERNFKLFRARFPLVRTFAPWNEINHFTQPTSRNPKAAARFTDIARRNCRGCKIVVADILDQPDSNRVKKTRYRSTARYIKRFKRALKAPRTICGLHNYSDTNRFRDRGTKAIIKALRCKEIWLTETGGIYKFRAGKLNASTKRQLRATKYMFKVARRYPRIKRLYVYTWFGATTPRFDAGLVAHGKPRPAYDEVRKRLR